MKKRDKIQLSIKYVVAITLFILEGLHKINITPLELDQNNIVFKVIAVIYAIGIIVIAAVFGSYQNKVEGNKINVATVLREKQSRTEEDKKAYKLERLKVWLNASAVVLLAIVLPSSVGFLLSTLTIVTMILLERKNKFEAVDILYDTYIAGALAMVLHVFGGIIL